MAFDTVVDKAQLEGAITASANAIRGKTGSAGLIPWDASTGFADAISAIEAGGGGASRKPVILEVEKITSDTYAGGKTYSDESFILLDIYPQRGGTVTVTYGDLSKIITDDGTSENPNAQQVCFGTFNGVSDEVETPASGTLTISGDYAAFGIGIYAYSSKNNKSCGCITGVTDFGDIEYIPDNAFGSDLGGCTKLEIVNIPYNVTSIGEYAFGFCMALPYLAIPYGVTTIKEGLVYNCQAIRDVIIPNSVTNIGYYALGDSNLFVLTIPESVTNIADYAFSAFSLKHVRMLSETPPTIGEEIVDISDSSAFTSFIVPSGCGDVYKTAEGWSVYADYIEEGA